jgi:MoxR-like ATPase
MLVNQLLIECEQVLFECDVRNLSSAATAAAKLGEIDRSLAGLKPDARVEKARTHVREQVKKLKLASLEAV